MRVVFFLNPKPGPPHVASSVVPPVDVNASASMVNTPSLDITVTSHVTVLLV